MSNLQCGQQFRLHRAPGLWVHPVRQFPDLALERDQRVRRRQGRDDFAVTIAVHVGQRGDGRNGGGFARVGVVARQGRVAVPDDGLDNRKGNMISASRFLASRSLVCPVDFLNFFPETCHSA